MHSDEDGQNPPPPPPLTKTTGLALRLEQNDNVVHTNGTDKVAYEGADVRALLAVLGIQQLNADLGHASTGAGAAETLDNAGIFNLLPLVLHPS